MKFEEALKESQYVTYPNSYGIDYYYISNDGFEYSIRENGGKPIIQLAMLKSAHFQGIMSSNRWEVATPSERIRNFFIDFENRMHIEMPGAKNE